MTWVKAALGVALGLTLLAALNTRKPPSTAFDASSAPDEVPLSTTE